MEKKSSKEYSVVFLVEGEKFNLGEKNKAIKFMQKVQICLVGSVRARSAHRLSSQLFAAVSTPNIAELVLFGFFCPQPWFSRRSEHILPGKIASIFMLIGNLLRRKKGKLVYSRVLAVFRATEPKGTRLVHTLK